MFEVGDVVLYTASIICRIVEITTKDFGGKESEYYILRPIYDENATVYIPTNNERLIAKMRSILTKEEVLRLIHALPETEAVWINDEHKRKEEFQKILDSGDRYEILKLIKTLYLHQQTKLQQGKRKMHVSDEKFFKDAERLIYDEFAFVLNIAPNKVGDFINHELALEV